MTKTLLIGLDGATFDVLDRLIESGDMPHIGSLVEGGVRARLRSTVNPLTAQAWPSLMTGCSPGQHGLLDFAYLEATAAGARFKISSSRNLLQPTIWELLSNNGERVTVLNYFGLYPPLPINGHSIAAFIPWRHLKSAVYPPELYDQLLTLPCFDKRELAMDLDMEKKCIQGMSPEEYEPWIELHKRREKRWAQILRHLMTTQPSDLSAIVFDGVDKLQHACWRFIDVSSLGEHFTAWEMRIRDLCLDYFRALDGYIGEAVTLAGPDARTLIVSDHGFGPSWEVFYANAWLAQRGDLIWRDEHERDNAGWLTPGRLKSQIELVNWAATRAYAATPSSNGISIVISHDGSGPGVPPAEYHAYREALRRDLLAFRDEAGRPVITAVRTREEAYPGVAGAAAPDLLLTLRDGGFLSIMNADAVLRPRDELAGTHRPEGIFIAAGPDVRSGTILPDLSILDVAPLLLSWHGIEPPPQMEGRIPRGVLRADTAPVPHRPPVAVGAISTDDADADADAQEAVLERLRGLGYVE